MDGIYLDYNGSAPLDPRVAEVMARALAEGVGNASSVHRFGRRQAAAADEAREHVAALVGGRASGVVFTSGATEANNLALRGAVEGRPLDRHRILVSAVEHASVSRTAAWLGESGRAAVEVIPVTPGGFVDADERIGGVDRRGGALRWSAGHNDGCPSVASGSDSTNAAEGRRLAFFP